MNKGGTALVLLIFAAGVAAGWVLHRPPGLSPAVRELVVRHDTQTVRDTARENAAQRAADRAWELQRAAQARAAAERWSADSARARADSLAQVAAAQTSAHDSAETWHAAYTERTEEAGHLVAQANQLREALTFASSRADSLAVRGDVAILRAARADSVIQILRPIAEARGDGCRIRLPLVLNVRCPTRTETAIAAVLGGVAIGEGWVRLPVKLPLRLPF